MHDNPKTHKLSLCVFGNDSISKGEWLFNALSEELQNLLRKDPIKYEGLYCLAMFDGVECSNVDELNKLVSEWLEGHKHSLQPSM